MEEERTRPSKVSSEENSRIHCSRSNHELDTKRPSSSSSSSFDCSVCLDFAADPVITLCGHLYCWPCIYKWLAIDSTCPVCKSLISQNQLVPLYGRDSNSTGAVTGVENIPERPAFVRNATVDQHGLSSLTQYSSADGVLMRLVSAILPLLRRTSGTDHGSVNFLRTERVGMIGDYSSENERVREREVENSLHQIWMFLFFCAVLWWLSC